MPAPFLRIVKQSGLYALGNISVKAAGLLLAPVFLNPAYLSIEAYGYFALLNVTGQLGIFVVGLGLGTGLLRFMTSEAHAEVRDVLPFTALATTVAAAVLGGGLLWVLAPALAGLLLDDPGQARLVHYLALYVAFKVVGGVPMVLLRIRERAGWYATAVAVEMALLLAAVYGFVVVRGEGLEGVMQAYAVAAGGSMLVLTGVMLRHIRWCFRTAMVRPLIRFGVPLVLAGLAGWFLNAGDRYLLKWLADPETTGLYDWSARLAGVINLLFVQSFQLAFNVIGLKALAEGDLSVHRRTFRHYVVWTGWAVLGLSLLTLDGMLLLVSRFDVAAFYVQAEALVLPLALGFLSYGVYLIANSVLYATGETGLISLNVAGAALLNAGLNLALIPFFGALGAALTTFVSYTVLAVGVARQAERRRRVGYPWRVFVLTLVLVVGLFALGRLTAAWSPGVRLTVRVGLILAYVPLLQVTNLYRREELRAGLRWVKERLR
ncbi:MAG: hypothetical protein KatS3mg044_1109 [Rhodothermaceae bacterium]|nr:MAG: hypothetical protein KatS3mg044_1109 [Rhodothermaceae bacterium]